MKAVTAIIVDHPTTTLLILVAAAVWLIVYAATRSQPANQPVKAVATRRRRSYETGQV